MIRKSLVVAASLLAIPAFAQTAGNTGSSMGSSAGMSGGADAGTGSMAAMGDKEILNKIHLVNQMEISMGKLAKTNATNPQVKSYAEKMVKSHTAADKKVMDAARKQKITLDKTPKTEDEKSMKQSADAQLKTLKTKRGAQFDQAYMTAMVDGHTQTLTMLQDAQGKGSPETNKVVSALTAEVQQHKDEATQIQSSLK